MNIRKLLLSVAIVSSLVISVPSLAKTTQANGQDNAQQMQQSIVQKVDVNKASADELEAVNGLGSSKAKAIVSYREQNGPFKSLEELDNVPGIGKKLLGKIRDELIIT